MKKDLQKSRLVQIIFYYSDFCSNFFTSSRTFSFFNVDVLFFYFVIIWRIVLKFNMHLENSIRNVEKIKKDLQQSRLVQIILYSDGFCSNFFTLCWTFLFSNVDALFFYFFKELTNHSKIQYTLRQFLKECRKKLRKTCNCHDWCK